jgi:hypothetical protein
MVANLETMHALDDGTNNYTYPSSYTIASDTKDTLNYGEMLQAFDRSNFVTAMQTEMDGLRDILQPCLRSTLPAGIKALPVVWAFKWK